jgi:hypothetical protein
MLLMKKDKKWEPIEVRSYKIVRLTGIVIHVGIGTLIE